MTVAVVLGIGVLALIVGQCPGSKHPESTRSGAGSSGSEKKSPPLMHGGGAYLAGFVQFKNDEDFEVTNCNLGLLSAGDDGYVLVYPRIPPHGDTGPMIVDEFVKVDTDTKRPTGERFNPNVKPKAWMMFCHSPTGEQIGGVGMIK